METETQPKLNRDSTETLPKLYPRLMDTPSGVYACYLIPILEHPRSSNIASGLKHRVDFVSPTLLQSLIKMTAVAIVAVVAVKTTERVLCFFLSITALI